RLDGDAEESGMLVLVRLEFHVRRRLHVGVDLGEVVVAGKPARADDEARDPAALALPGEALITVVVPREYRVRHSAAPVHGSLEGVADPRRPAVLPERVDRVMDRDDEAPARGRRLELLG